MPSAIVVKFLGPTNFRGSRWSVSAAHMPRKVYSRHHALGGNEDAARCAKDYATGLEWWGDWHGGELPDGRRVYVLHAWGNSKHPCPDFVVTCKVEGE